MPKHGNTNVCGFCMGPIRFAEMAWVHTDPSYDPFDRVHVPTPANLGD